MIILGIFLALAAAVLLICLYCYRTAFYSAPRNFHPDDPIRTPVGKEYEPYREKMEHWARQTRQIPREECEITAFDGLKLRGRYYEYAPGAPIELMFHGYRGDSERDLSGGVQRCFAIGRSALVVDQRASGCSEGSTITFGVNERRDCLSWIDFALSRFGPDVKLILTGISMGAATVLMAGGEELPENVMGILADCGYSSQKQIMYKVLREMGLPPGPVYPFVKLAARLFGGFDLEETTPLEAVKKCRVPVIFFHGESDDFVPCDMSRELYEACSGKKHLCTVPGAGHGLSYAVDPKGYLKDLGEFFGPEASGKRPE